MVQHPQLVLPLSSAVGAPETVASGEGCATTGRAADETRTLDDEGDVQARAGEMRTTREELRRTAERRRADIRAPTRTRGRSGTVDGGERRLPSRPVTEQRCQRARASRERRGICDDETRGGRDTWTWDDDGEVAGSCQGDADDARGAARHRRAAAC